ncbi:hypothetical protein V6N13_030075 [Hibiscus sabdariffa]
MPFYGTQWVDFIDSPRGHRGLHPARGRGRGHRADVIQDAPGIPDPPPTPIGFQQVGGDAPPVQGSPVVDPSVQNPPVGDPPVGDPPNHVVGDPDEIDEVMAGRAIWRFLQRVGVLHLEIHKTTILESYQLSLVSLMVFLR